MEHLRLDNAEFEGRNSVYLFRGERTTLVDAGLATPAVREQLAAELARHDVAFADLDAVLLTHWHPDHAGLAGTVQSASGATVYAHPADAALAGGDPAAREDLSAARDRKLTAWGTPDEQRAELVEFMAAHEGEAGDPADVTPLSDGETVRAGGETLRAVHTPGHTDGHLCYVREDGTVLTGDALLPEYTPNVGGADPRVEAPLSKYLDTLSWLADAGFDRAHPGHREAIADPAGRAREIRDHHRERARRVFAYLREEGPADAWTVSAHLFGSLAGIHIVHGPGEAYAHLDHLQRHGLAERDGDRYRATAADADFEDLFP